MKEKEGKGMMDAFVKSGVKIAPFKGKSNGRK